MPTYRIYLGIMIKKNKSFNVETILEIPGDMVWSVKSIFSSTGMQKHSGKAHF